MTRGLAVFVILLVAAGCSPRGDGAGEDAVLARVNGRQIRLSDVDARIADVPKLARPEYSGPIGRKRMLNKMLEEEVFYQAAIDEGVDREEEVVRAVHDLTRQTIVQAYLDRVHERVSRVDDEEARTFYDEHIDEYRTERMIRVRLMVNPSEKIVTRAYSMVRDGTLEFEEACARFSEDPFIVSARGLVPTWIRKDRAIPWIGNRPKFHEVAFSLAPDEVSEPFESGAGWMLVRVEEVRESRQRPFDEVKKDVVGRISRGRSTAGLPELLAELNARYGVEILDLPGAKSADELFSEAQAAPDPRKRVALYEELVRRFPDFERTLDAHFMVGFIYSEELKDPEKAKASFEQVIELAPDSDLAQSARWMLTSGEKDPPFEDDDWTSPEEGTP